MRIAELSRAAGVPVPTIKFYLREGLLPPGRRTARNQAEYGDEHLRRLRLVRVLRDVGGLTLAQVRDVLAAIEDERLSPHEMLGVAQRALARTPDGDDPGHAAARREIDDLLAALGWRVSEAAPARRSLADALVALRRLGRDVTAETFRPYADDALRIAEREVRSVIPSSSRAEAVERMVVGTVVYEKVLIALRRLAHEHVSATRSPFS